MSDGGRVPVVPASGTDREHPGTDSRSFLLRRHADWPSLPHLRREPHPLPSSLNPIPHTERYAFDTRDNQRSRSLTGIAPAALQANSTCPSPSAKAQAALETVFSRQEEIDELRAGGHGPLRIAYMHPEGEPYEEALAKRASVEGLEVGRYPIARSAASLAETARQIAEYRPDWTLVSGETNWHGAVLTALADTGVASGQVIRLQRAARLGGDLDECPSRGETS